MGKYGIDNWCRRMRDHELNGDRIIVYPESRVFSLDVEAIQNA